MTTPPTPLSVQEQVIEQRLVECGLNKGGFTVKYEDYLQGIEIVIASAAGAREAHFPCIREAVDHEFVRFADGAMQKAYSDFETAMLRPQMLEHATAEVKKRGLLQGFPDRAHFTSLDQYAQAVERHSGLAPGSALRVSGQSIVFDPPRGRANFDDFYERYADLLAVIMFATARGDFKNVAFVGNEATLGPEAK